MTTEKDGHIRGVRPERPRNPIYNHAKFKPIDVEGEYVETIDVHGRECKGRITTIYTNTVLVKSEDKVAYIVHKETLDKSFERVIPTYYHQGNSVCFDLEESQRKGYLPDTTPRLARSKTI